MIKYTHMDEMHVQQVAQLEKASFSDPWSENSIRSELNNPLSLWVVALDGETVVGYVGSQSVLGESDMMNIAVSDQYRGQNIATTLVNVLIDQLRKQGNYQLTLEVRISNEPARKLYEKLGFLEVGRRPNYYHNPKEDALILRKEWEA